MEEMKIGEVIKFYDNLGVAVVHLSSKLSLGESLHFRGARTDFEQEASSIQINSMEVEDAKMGDEVGIIVGQPVETGDILFRVIE